MSSIIEGYNYDIFISYRQKDNKGDRWVSEFVEALKTELESTFKEEISVYFDINPHDGLLETHDVDESLKEKLKCLIFIPIISRTYCDPKSFAWEREFKAFVEQASQDQFGLKVKLLNGNVASRVLPIQIHDLKVEDKLLVENELGGFIRAIEFIYKESGVNRPLTPKDSEDKNTNKTNYRNQINKVANAIDEVISGLKREPTLVVKENIPATKESLVELKKEDKKEVQERPAKLAKWKLLSGTIVIGILLIIAAILAYPKIFKQNTLKKIRSSGERISVAVMPFQNITRDSTWNNWQDGIKDELINYLTNYNKELEVRQTESINALLKSKGLTNYASITPSVASTISQKLDAKVFIYGSIKQAGDKIRVNAQLIDSRTEEALKSFQIEGPSQVENILNITDSLSRMVKNFLVISSIEKEIQQYFRQLVSTNSPEAYSSYKIGHDAFYKMDYPAAVNWLQKAIDTDSNFVEAMVKISYAYGNQGKYKEAKYWCCKAYVKKNLVPRPLQLWTDVAYATWCGTPNEVISCLKQYLDIDDQFPDAHYRLGNAYNKLFQYDKAIVECEKALEIFNNWGTKPMWVPNYISLGFAYHKTEDFKKEKELYKKAEQDFPDNPALIYSQAVLSLTDGDSVVANDYINKYISLRKEGSATEATITTNLAGIFFEANILNRAEEYYRNALSLEPENSERLNNIAYFLIDKDRNINEGMKLVNKALELSPNNYSYLHTEGWGLYKQGKFQVALEILQKSWDIREEKAVYDHEAFLHLEAAKKAVANQKNN